MASNSLEKIFLMASTSMSCNNTLINKNQFLFLIKGSYWKLPITNIYHFRYLTKTLVVISKLFVLSIQEFPKNGSDYNRNII